MNQALSKHLSLAVLLLSLFAPGTGAAAGGYKQVSGEVVSIDQNSIVVKNKTKGSLTLAITKGTDMVGPAVKAGDQATVRYQAGKEGNRATRISMRKAAAAPKHAAAPSTEPAKTRQ